MGSLALLFHRYVWCRLVATRQEADACEVKFHVALVFHPLLQPARYKGRLRRTWQVGSRVLWLSSPGGTAGGARA